MSRFYGKEWIVYGKVWVGDVAIALCWSRLHVSKCTKRRWIVSVGVIYNVWLWYCAIRRRIAAYWVKCGLTGGGGRSVAFSFWNVMWWSCGGFCTISRKSVWIFFSWIFFIFFCLHPSLCCASSTYDIVPLDGDPGQCLVRIRQTFFSRPVIRCLFVCGGRSLKLKAIQAASQASLSHVTLCV